MHNPLMKDIAKRLSFYRSLPMNPTANSLGRKIQAAKSLQAYVSEAASNVSTEYSNGWQLLSELETIHAELERDKLAAHDLLENVRQEDLQYLRPIGDNQAFMMSFASLFDENYVNSGLPALEGARVDMETIVASFSLDSQLTDDQRLSIIWHTAAEVADEAEPHAEEISAPVEKVLMNLDRDGSDLMPNDRVTTPGGEAGIVLETHPDAPDVLVQYESDKQPDWENAAGLVKTDQQEIARAEADHDYKFPYDDTDMDAMDDGDDSELAKNAATTDPCNECHGAGCEMCKGEGFDPEKMHPMDNPWSRLNERMEQGMGHKSVGDKLSSSDEEQQSMQNYDNEMTKLENSRKGPLLKLKPDVAKQYAEYGSDGKEANPDLHAAYKNLRGYSTGSEKRNGEKWHDVHWHPAGYADEAPDLDDLMRTHGHDTYGLAESMKQEHRESYPESALTPAKPQHLKAEGKQSLPFGERTSMLSYPEVGKVEGDACSVAEDKNGVYVKTHRARSDSYPTIEDIPQKEKDFIASTAAAGWGYDDPDKLWSDKSKKSFCPGCGSEDLEKIPSKPGHTQCVDCGLTEKNKEFEGRKAAMQKTACACGCEKDDNGKCTCGPECKDCEECAKTRKESSMDGLPDSYDSWKTTDPNDVDSPCLDCRGDGNCPECGGEGCEECDHSGECKTCEGCGQMDPHERKSRIEDEAADAAYDRSREDW